MCLSCRQSARSFDFFGAPIGVTYKSEPTFKTTAGGCITIWLLVLFGGNLLLSIFGVLIYPQYNDYTTTDYFKFAQNAEEGDGWTLSTVN